MVPSFFERKEGKEMIKDMTKGEPGKVLLGFMLPMLGSVVFQQMYNIIDSVVAGKCIGPDALAAVGVSYPITMIFVAIAMGMNVGCSVLISQLFGAKKMKELKTTVFTALISVLVLSLVLTIFGQIGCNAMIRLLQTPDDIFKSSSLFLRIYIFGLIFVFLYNICNGIFTALGDSATPFYFLVASSVGNIILDLVFVVCFHFGVGGLAWATFTAQGMAAVLAFWVLMRRMKKIETEEYQKFSGEMLKKLAYLSIPSILQQSFVSVGNLFIQSIVNSYGSVVIAGYAGAIKLNTFAVTSFTTISNSLSNFVAQNVGAGKLERVKQGFRSCFKMSVCIIIPFSLLYVFGGNLMMRVFVNADSQAVIQEGVLFLRIVAPFYLTVGVKLVCDGVLRGAAAMKLFMITTFGDLILRVLLAFVLQLFWGAMGIWLAWPVGWTGGMCMSIAFYARGSWKKKNGMIG